MFISIVIPCYNDQRGLNRLLKSILQSFDKGSNTEVIVVDDCSDQKIEVRIEEIPSKLLRNKKNRGPGYSRARGAEKAKGEYLLFIDSDDLFKKEINNVIDKIRNNDIVMFGSEERMNDELLYYWQPRKSNPIYKNIHSWNFIVKKDIWNSVEINSSSIHFEDWHHFLKLFYNEKELKIKILENSFPKIYNVAFDSLSRAALNEENVELPDLLKDDQIITEAKQYVSRLWIRNFVSRGLSFRKSRLMWDKISSNIGISYSFSEFVIDYMQGKIPSTAKISLKKYIFKSR